MDIDTNQQIIAAAIKLKSGLILTLSKPARHNNIMDCLNDNHGTRKLLLKESIAGFMLDDGSFISRDAATAIYRKQGKELIGSVLTSEDLW